MPVPTTLDVDPLAKVLEPPPDETPMERDARLSAAAKAKQISEEIDEELEREKTAESKGVKALKMLLLGQSESGKSTTLKNLQLLYDPKTFGEERALWRAVIQLNVVHSVRVILDALAQVKNETSPASSPDQSRPLNPELFNLKTRLSPLIQVEQVLTRRLTLEELRENEEQLRDNSLNERLDKEVTINASRAWKEALVDLSQQTDQANDSDNDPGVVLNACAQDILLLWNDFTVRTLLKEQSIHMEEVAGLYEWYSF
ncbi:hypothetical protein C0991_007064 [Blastosporella zonata]|nr:hypothetical protein C0991_007064 [Blastosporella zonata]